MLDILVFLLTISYCTVSGYTLTTSSENATVGLDFTFTCATTDTLIVFTRDVTTVCIITGGNTDGTCVFNGYYITEYIYTCNPTTNTYTLTIPGSNLTESLHGTTWSCRSPFGGAGSNITIFYLNVPVSSATLLSRPTDTNPVEVVANRDQTFSCTTNAARPSSRIQWYLFTTNITTSASPQLDVCNTDCSDDKVISSSVLTYTGNINDDGKILYCTAINMEGLGVVRSSDKTIVIWYGPRQIVISPATSDYTRNETLDRLGPINCTANCKPACTSTWNGPNLPTGTTSVLNLANIDRNQAGNYQCTASNVVSSLISATIYVVVNYQPTISSISNDKIVNENDTVTITCTVDSIPQSIISWIFERKQLQNKYDGSLTMNKIDCLSMGRYTCQAVNMLGGDNRYVDVTVTCSPRINDVEFTIPSTITIKDGEMLNITAHIIAFPKPEMYWQFGQNGLYINVSSGITNSFNINRHSSYLVKRNVIEADFGIYRLYAYNGVGSIQYFLHSFVVLPEKQPTSPTVVFVVCQTTSATVLWKPEMNEGSTQTFFVKFWSPSQSSQATLTPAISDPGSDADVQYIINNLVPEAIYIFQIIARNVYGDSLSKSVNCTTNERQYLTSPTSSDQSGLFTAAIACLIISLLSVIFAVSFVVYWRFRLQKKTPMRNNDYTECNTCKPMHVVTDQYDMLNTTNMGTNDEHENQTDRNIHTYEECQPSNNTDRTYQRQTIQSTGATEKTEYIYDNMKI